MLSDLDLSDRWLGDTLDQIPARFHQALERWQTLYAAAAAQYRKHSDRAVLPSVSYKDKEMSRRLRNEAERQLDILRMKADQRGQSDFYTYRYFASEGFLPGYSFPRLPLSAYIPGHGRRGRSGDYLQRPRFLAISEFGPGTYIYHEGSRYQITRVLLSRDAEGPDQDSDGVLTDRAKMCGDCGYTHAIADGPGPDVCEYCSADLDFPTELGNLLRMRHVSTRHRSLITSDEEKRRRKGYELVSGIRFAERGGHRSVIKTTVNSEHGDPMLRLSYGNTATIWRINLGWRRRKTRSERGFFLDLERGEWVGKDKEADSDNIVSATRKRVIPYVTDVRNALLVQPVENLTAKTMASLAAALKTAIQVVFQLEPSELEVEPLPTRDNRRLLLFYESAEGGAGVLRQLVQDPDGWRRAASEGLRLCHIKTDPDTGALAEDPEHGCGGACYSCLLTYQNQWDHDLLDRKLAVPILKRLTTATLDIPAHQQQLETTTTLEDDFVAHLEASGYRLPDEGQKYFEAARTRPDFVYHDDCVVIYVDGPHHDYPDRAKRDREQETAIRDLGYRTIRFGYRDDWNRIIAEHRDVFGSGHDKQQRL